MPPNDVGSLAEAQRLLWRIVVAPEGVQAALDNLDTETSPGAGPRQLAALVSGEGTLPPLQRVDVYANAYFSRILDVLEKQFPALRSVIGEAPFRDLATSYLAVRPPTHYSLRYAGAGLAELLEAHPAGEAFRRRFACCVDLARLEWALVTAFDAEDSDVARRSDLSEIAPVHFAGLRLEFTPSVQIFECRFAVHDLRKKFETNELAETSAAESAQTVCVWREEERAFHRVLDPLEASAVRGVQAAMTFGELCELAERELGEARAAESAAAWLGRWLDDGLLARIY